MARKKNTEFRVGLFVIIPVITLLIFVMIKMGYSFEGSTIDVYLKVDTLTSVEKGTLIKIKGYNVGRVVKMRPVFKPALHFLATLRLNKDIELHEDCSAIIMNQNIIGDTIIELKNPEKKGNLLQDGDVLEGLEYVNLESLMKNVNALLLSVSSTANVFKEISMNSRGDIQKLMKNLADSGAQLSKFLETAQVDVIQILKSFRKTAVTMQEISTELKKHPVKFLFKDDDKK
jgi:ABC-type transporter Mla subunit MlaD